MYHRNSEMMLFILCQVMWRQPIESGA